MNTTKTTGQIVGVLFLTLMVAYIIGMILIDPVLNATNLFTEIGANKNRLFIGVLFELINGLAYLGIAVLLYPILKKPHEQLALLYLALRIIEFTMQMVSDISPLILITSSEKFTELTHQNTGVAEALGSSLLALRYWANNMVFITYGLGAVIFYTLAYKMKLFPRFLSVWGIIGAPLVLLGVILDSISIDIGVDLGLVMGLNEIVLGIWLIAKGFNVNYTSY